MISRMRNSLLVGLFSAMMAMPSLRAEELTPSSPSAFERDPAGWQNLLADATLSNWERIPPSPDAKYALAANSPWSFDPKSGILTCRAEGGYELFLEKAPRKDGIIHVEWRYIGRPEKPDSGILVRASRTADTWLQAQLAVPGLGTMSNKVRPADKDKKVSAVGARHPEWMKPEGEWNVMEVDCQGPKIWLWFNGRAVAEVSNYGIDEPYVGLQAEYKPIEFRNVQFKPLEP